MKHRMSRKRIKAFIRRHRGNLIAILVIILIIILHLPIQVKQAIDITAVHVNQPVDFDALVGSPVTVLCRRVNTQVTEPPDYDYNVIGIQRDDVFLQWELSQYTPFIDIYVYPKMFVGFGVQDSLNTNLFVFRGTLEKASYLDGADGDYRIRLTSWDILAPVHHGASYFSWVWEACDDCLFLSDFWLPFG